LEGDCVTRERATELLAECTEDLALARARGDTRWVTTLVARRYKLERFLARPVHSGPAEVEADTPLEVQP
jgi:hypothetical protein